MVRGPVHPVGSRGTSVRWPMKTDAISLWRYGIIIWAQRDNVLAPYYVRGRRRPSDDNGGLECVCTLGWFHLVSVGSTTPVELFPPGTLAIFFLLWRPHCLITIVPLRTSLLQVLRPASEGHTTKHHDSGIPKLTARKPVGQQVHDEGLLDSSRPSGQRRSNRASARGEMSGPVTDYMAAASGGEGDGNEPLVSDLKAELSREREKKGMHAPIAERMSRAIKRRESTRLEFGDDDDGDDEDDLSEDEWDTIDAEGTADEIQQEQLQMALNERIFPFGDNPDGDGYDSDDDLRPVITEEDPDYMDLDNHEHVRKNEDGSHSFDWGGLQRPRYEELKRDGLEFDERGGRQDNDGQDKDPIDSTLEYQYYFQDVTELDDNVFLLRPPKPESKAVLPLKPHGPNLDDFLWAVTSHPSKYSRIERKVKHPDSKREPQPTFLWGRKLPGEEFVEKYKGYLFVEGLVPDIDGATGEVQDFQDELHKQSIAKKAAEIFGVKTMDVCPATPTSAYVGFKKKLEAKKAMIACAEGKSLAAEHPIAVQKYVGGKVNAKDPDVIDWEEGVNRKQKKFVVAAAGGPASIVKVTRLPARLTNAELMQSMFPPGSPIESLFGLSAEDFLRVSPTTALIRFASADRVADVFKSKLILNNIKAAGQQSVQVYRAKRERVFDHWTGVNRHIGESKLGTRLFVTGDVPPHEMYLSHHDTLHLSGLPPTTTLRDLATFFQPFSADRRDERGSGHIVRCSRGLPSGCAYVGFELPGEIDQVLELYKGKAIINGERVTLRSVKDKLLRRGVRSTARPARTIEELRSDLYDWERHVDPKDIEELERLGVGKDVLNEVMITLRHHNRTFAAADQAISGEKLYQERRTGAHYRDAVRRYLKTLKSCVATREDPGLMYQAMFKQGEDIDMGLFDIEEDRIKELRKKGV
ncbi:hypothetical protein ACHAWF_011334 [Thalassiosira exigua]